MSLLRRWLDPIRSRWFFNRPFRQRRLSSRDGITVYLRFDDAYSYLLVQLLPELEELLNPQLKPLKIMLCSQASPRPNDLSERAWQHYMLDDARALAAQHRFIFDNKNNQVPSSALIQQAQDILKLSPLRGLDSLNLLQDLFHMLWQQQQGKLNTLHYMATRRQPALSRTDHKSADNQNAGLKDSGSVIIRFVDEPIHTAFLLFGGRHYRAIDDFLRLTRRLKQQKLLNNEPIFLINHIEWGEHLVSDPELLNDIQALHATLDIYLALEDPISWLILAYIKRELVDYYNLDLRVHPLPYQGRDDFDWALVARLARRTEVAFAPFCRPTQTGVLNVASILYDIESEARSDALLSMLHGIWCKGRDADFVLHLQQFRSVLCNPKSNPNSVPDLEQAQAQAWLDANQLDCQAYQQPDLPLMVLQIGQQQHVFNSLYRVWRIESLLTASA